MNNQFSRSEPVIILLAFYVVFLLSVTARAQTSAFTYQGRLTDGGTAANGIYDLQFTLWDSAGGGLQIGSTQSLPSVQISSGIFTVTLDFGANAFPGADRFLEISGRLSGASAFTILTPRQQITSTPYAVRSGNATIADNATQLGGVGASQYVQTGDPRLTDARTPTAGSSSYIQNTTNQQSGNFNVSGDGTTGGTLSGNVVNAAAQYNIAGNRVLVTTGAGNFANSNTFVGANAGVSTTPSGMTTAGNSNTFVGNYAGNSNTTGRSNTFLGWRAGLANVIGVDNTFLGLSAGFSNLASQNTFVGTVAGGSNTTGTHNSFFGYATGDNGNTVQSDNTFVGFEAGINNGTNDDPKNPKATDNSFVGSLAGFSNTTGGFNSFVGSAAGYRNTTGGSNSFVGSLAGMDNTTGAENSFFGNAAGRFNSTGQDNSFFGFAAGFNNQGDRNSFFGANAGELNLGSFNAFFGYNSGLANRTGQFNSFYGYRAGESNVSGVSNSFFGGQAGFANDGSNNAFFGGNAGVNNNTGQGNTLVGSGSGVFNTLGSTNTFMGNNAGSVNTTGSNNTTIGANADVGANNLDHATAVGADAVVSSSNTITLGRSNGADFVVVPGTTLVNRVLISTLGAAGAVSLCRNFLNEIATCASSLRYKKEVTRFAGGLDIVNRLQPIAFTWKDHPERDLGFGAEEVARVEPLLVTYNSRGEAEGVKYDRLSAVLVNAIKEQQNQIRTLQAANAALSVRLRSIEKTLPHRRGRRRL